MSLVLLFSISVLFISVVYSLFFLSHSYSPSLNQASSLKSSSSYMLKW